ncbi:hypothetical protein BsWGS_12124 [Bradybaena similaris]
MPPKSIKITYSDQRGRAEVLRLLLVAAGQEFEDCRLNKEQFEAEKSKTPYNQLPVIDVDGRRHAQTIAIASYLAREFGFYGKDNLDALAIDEIVQLNYDFLNAFVKVYFETDESKKAELMKHFKEVECPKYFGFFENLLKKNDTGFFVGDCLSVADLYVYDFAYFLKMLGVTDTANYSHFQNLVEKVESNERIKAYLATRKQTPT